MKLPKITRVKDIIAKKTGNPSEVMIANVYHKLGHEQFLKRETVRREITTVDKWKLERERLRTALISTFGGPLPNEKIKIRECGKVRKKNLTIETILFAPFGDHWVAGNLYLPANSADKLPVVILAHGHGVTGKYSLRERAAFFAANGYAAFTFDYTGGGERNIVDSNGEIPAFPSGQHNIVGNRMNLCGYNFQWFMLAETVAAIDYVSSRPEIDPERICMTGASGGGTETFLTAAIDERIKVLAPAASLRANCGEIEADDTEQVWFNAITAGLGYPDIASFLIAPRPMLIVTNKKDIWSYDQIEYFTREVRGFYKMLGKEENFAQTVRDRGHAYQPDQVEDSLRWFNKHFDNNTEFVSHENIDPENIPSEEECATTEKSNLFLSGFTDPITVFAKIAKKRHQPAADKRHAIEKFIEKHASGLDANREIECEVIDTYQVEGFRGNRILYSPEPGIWLPVEILIPKDADGISILLDETSRMSDLEWQMEHARTGKVTVRPDLRGLGDTANKDEWSDWENWSQNVYSGKRYRLSALARVMGRNIIMDRAADISALLNVLRNMGFDGEVSLHGRRVGALTAIFAALLDARFATPNVEACIDSYWDHLEAAFPISWGDEIVYGILAEGIDIPDIQSYLKNR